MKVREINADEFTTFSTKHLMKNFYQTKQYGSLMSHSDFNTMYIGGYENNQLVAASLVLYKSLSVGMKYGYAPRGFLIDYSNRKLLQDFTKGVKDLFFKKGFAFIKINPEINSSILNFDEKTKTINEDGKQIIRTLKELGYDKLKDNLYFESVLPKYTPVIYLPGYEFDDLDQNLIDTLRHNELSGIKLTVGNEEDLETFYSFINEQDSKTFTYYKYFYQIFKKDDMVDLLLIELNYDTYVKYLQKQYIYEQEKNEKINYEFHQEPNNMELYNKKMASDQVLAKISSDIVLANTRMQEDHNREILGGAFVVKNQGRITIIASGNNNSFAGIDLKTYMYYKIIKEYKEADYIYLDLNGITADFSDTNPYKELNEFKLKFKPTCYEYIGEFDLIVNKPFHQLLWSTNKIQKEFYKPAIKK